LARFSDGAVTFEVHDFEAALRHQSDYGIAFFLALTETGLPLAAFRVPTGTSGHSQAKVNRPARCHSQSDDTTRFSIFELNETSVLCKSSHEKSTSRVLRRGWLVDELSLSS
jgi:hypothetical protein